MLATRLRVYAWLRVKIEFKGTSVRTVLWCGLDHGTRQFLMCWLRVYAGLPVNLILRVALFGGVKSWNLDHTTREFVMSLGTRQRVATLQN